MPGGSRGISGMGGTNGCGPPEGGPQPFSARDPCSAGLCAELAAGPGGEALDLVAQEDDREDDAEGDDRDDQCVLDEALGGFLVTEPCPGVLAANHRPENDVQHAVPPWLSGASPRSRLSPVGRTSG